MASYPTSASSLSTSRSDSTTRATNLAGDINGVNDEVNALTSDLVTARGASANLAARLTAIDALITANIANLVEDTTPQLGGDLDVNGNSIVSTSNGDITLTPNGTGDVVLGNFTLDADSTVGASQDNYVLTYDHSAGKLALEASAGGGGGDLLAANNLSDVASASTARTNLGLAIGSDVQAFDSVLSATTASFTTADETKLDGIEASADVTDETNVKAALDGATITEVTAVSGDFFLFMDTSDSGNLKKVDYDDLPGAGGGLSNIVEDTTPQLGGDLDLNGNSIDFPTTANISDVLDEDTMTSDSATALATQQSIKAYVDTASTADRTRSNHTGTQLHTTISDFDTGVQANRLDQMAAPTADLDINDNALDDVVVPVLTISGTTDTAALADRNGINRCTNASAVTITIPANATVAFPTGSTLTYRSAGAGGLTLSAAGGVTLNGNTTISQHEGLMVHKVATNEWDVYGGTAA